MNDGGPSGRWLCAAILRGLLEVKAKGIAACAGEGRRRRGEPLRHLLTAIAAAPRAPLSHLHHFCSGAGYADRTYN